MTRIINNPLMLGFDHLEKMLERVGNVPSDNYPPYNIEQVSESALIITLAVAGFDEKDLQVRVEDNQLIINGTKPEEGKKKVYIHQGIGARNFQRAFVIAEGIKVKGAKLEKGLLNISLERPKPETKIQEIKIVTSEEE
ncbi:MAG: Small heat shock protein IbpA [Alphaproteobacteria bacterium ADurb.Bin438]|nr:MAG: Small heat shock protein IbpA [Alphaproteobacteria bacterium ADurb.Bin438]